MHTAFTRTPGSRGLPCRAHGQPHVSWTPALGANAYEVQWSKTQYPFKPETSGYTTANTPLVLPVPTGTWYYRVRGFNWNMPSGSQQMSWSDPAKLVVAKPKFKIVKVGRPPVFEKTK